MRFDTPTGPRTLSIDHVTVAGWTGRDRASVDHHIAELAALGVAPPSAVPLFYRVAASLLTQDDTIGVLGSDTSGEVEPFVVRSGGEMFLGLASDHTDRALEATSVAASKQICAKPVAPAMWPWAEVVGHLDALELTTEIAEGGGWQTYQSGTLAAIRPLSDLVAGAALPDRGAMLCGTLPAIGGVRAANAWRMRLHDPVLGRSIRLGYSVSVLPIVA